jgi:hypothetical protein
MTTLFEREVCIRLSEDQTHLIATTRYGRFFRKTAEFDVTAEQTRETHTPETQSRETMDEAFAPLKKRQSYGADEQEQ